MHDHVNQFITPARSLSPEVVQLKWLDFSTERARNRADDQVAMHRTCGLQEDRRK